jgi:hypothetical protein
VPAIGCALSLFSHDSVPIAVLALILIGKQRGAEIGLVGYLLARLFSLRNCASAYGACVVFLGLVQPPFRHLNLNRRSLKIEGSWRTPATSPKR